MSSETEHLKLALHNIEVLAYLSEKPDFCDWTATVAFYTAVHVVEAVFFHDSKRIGFSHIQNHEERERILKSVKSYQNLYKHYRPLASASVIARYLQPENQKGLCEYMSHSQVTDALINHHLGQLIKSTGRFLSPDCTGELAEAFQRFFG